MSSLGEKDVAHIRHMIRRARGSAIAGRAMIGLGLDPITFIVGVAALAHAKIVENLEIGHNVMHGQYDWTNAPKQNSYRYYRSDKRSVWTKRADPWISRWWPSL